MFVYQITFLKTFSKARPTWKKEIGVEIDFSMNNILKDNFERNVGCSLVVVGPMIDGYLKHIGVVFKIDKLVSCSRLPFISLGKYIATSQS